MAGTEETMETTGGRTAYRNETQQDNGEELKAVLTTDDLRVVLVRCICFETDLPQFSTENGIIRHADGLTVTSPTIMWVKALDMLLERLKEENGVDLASIKAISGCGQQHGSVYWKRGASLTLKGLDPQRSLAEQLQDCFALSESPIWMDSSTTEECEMLEKAVGGPEIAKVYRKFRPAYDDTERISLVSSFACSLLLGRYAEIDFSDGSGMNLLDIGSRKWNRDLLTVAGGETLIDKLGDPVPTSTCAGNISHYFVDRFGFSPACKVAVFTGDNPSSLVGVNQGRGDVAISLGTSDTVFAWLDELHAALDGHVFLHPLDPNAYMALLCFKNGALTRDRVRKVTGAKTWEEFGELLERTPPGNHGNIGFYFDLPEILPEVPAGDHRFTFDKFPVTSFPAEVEARAIFEHQCLTKRVHAQRMGYRIGGRVVVTGGASANPHLLEILADVFKTDVHIQDVADSAAVGGAFRAKSVCYPSESNSATDSAHTMHHRLGAKWNKSTENVYDLMTSRYEELENGIVVSAK